MIKQNMTLKEKCELLRELNKDVTIFCDMDGVLAKWRTGDTVEEMWQPGYFYDLNVELCVRDALTLLLNAGFKCSALSAAFMNGIAEVDKGRWLDDYGLESLPRLFVPCGVSKSNFIDAKPGSTYILLDDYNFNLTSWANEKKGNANWIAVKFLNGINGNSDVWKGRTIYYKSSAETIAHTLADIAIMC